MKQPSIRTIVAFSYAAVSEFGDEAANFISRNFYVDDDLTSVPSVQEAVTLVKSSQAICASAKLRLHKFASNCKEVLETPPPEDHVKDLKDLDLRHDALPIQRSLGTYWCIESDTLGFRIELKEKPLSRRGILSTVSLVYDPLGIVSPVTLVGKQILQDLCRRNVDWDDPVPEGILPRWERWRTELPLLEKSKSSVASSHQYLGLPSKLKFTVLRTQVSQELVTFHTCDWLTRKEKSMLAS